MTKAATVGLVVALMLGGAACETSEPSVAYKLAAIHGDVSQEGAFQRILDCIRASGIRGAETEEKIGDTLVASWEASGKRDSLLEWSQTLC